MAGKKEIAAGGIAKDRCIINVSSTSGLHGNVGQANYAAGYKCVLYMYVNVFYMYVNASSTETSDRPTTPPVINVSFIDVCLAVSSAL